MKKGPQGNRSTGTVGDYLFLLARGFSQEEIGCHFGVSGGAVRKALLVAGLPSTARDYLSWTHMTIDEFGVAAPSTRSPE
jgi:hypothetical protein